MAVKCKVRHSCVMAADDPHFRLRVPEELRDRIRDAAEANKRSMNSEIVARLEDTFAPEYDTAALQAAYDAGRKDAINDADVLYVLLDGNGIPTSWNEIMLHLGNIVRAKGIEYRSLDAKIIDADVQSGSKREQEWYDLMLAYRKKLAKPSPSSED